MPEPRKIKIAFHADGRTAGGLAAFIRHLSEAFSKEGHEIVLLINRPGPFQNEMEKRHKTYCLGQDTVNAPGLNLGPVRIPNPVVAMKNFFSIRKNRKQTTEVLKSADPDIVLGAGMGSVAMLASSCNQLAVPLITCIHGIGNRSNDLLSIRSRISAKILNQADAVVGVSKACVERYRPFLKKQPQVIYNCCPPVQTNRSEKARFLTDKKLSAQTTVIGSFGRIQFAKGYHVLIRAIAKLDPQYRPAVIIGGKSLNADESLYLDDLRSLVNELGLGDRCFFVGEITPEKFFSLTDIFCHTYLGEEALGYTILEAMSAKRAVVAMDRGGPLEIIDDNKSGLLVPPDNPEKLAGAIERYLQDPKFSALLAANGQKTIQENFGFDEWPKSWLRLIFSCIDRIPA